MKIIDLSIQLYGGMEVYPGDPTVSICRLHSYENQGWELRKLSLGSHTGTHVDAFSHMHKQGKNLDQIPLERFLGPAMLVTPAQEFPKGIGLFFSTAIGIESLDKILEAKPNFIGGVLSEELERALLAQEIITYTNLCNLDQLPLGILFTFIGLPLKIEEGDGSPVRAIAILKGTN